MTTLDGKSRNNTHKKLNLDILTIILVGGRRGAAGGRRSSAGRRAAGAAGAAGSRARPGTGDRRGVVRRYAHGLAGRRVTAYAVRAPGSPSVFS